MRKATAKLRAELEKVRSANRFGEVVVDEAIEYAREHPDSQLHDHLDWDDETAGENWRRHQMAGIIRAVYILEKPGTDPVHAYWSPPSNRNGTNGYVPLARMRSDKSIAVEILRDTLFRVRGAHEDMVVAAATLPTLKPALTALGRTIDALQQMLDGMGTPPKRKPKSPPPPPPKRGPGRPPKQPPQVHV